MSLAHVVAEKNIKNVAVNKKAPITTEQYLTLTTNYYSVCYGGYSIKKTTK